MAEALEVPRIYARLLAARVRSDWQYRTSFVLFTISQAFVPLLDFAAIAVLFHQVPRIGGWPMAEVALMFGISATGFGLADALVGSVELVSRRVKEGTFDRLLTRPMGPLLQLTAEEFAFRRLGRMAQGVVVVVASALALDAGWSVVDVVLLVVFIASATVIYGGMWVATSSIAFWTVETQEMANAFTYGGNFASQYPLTIYATWLRRFLVLVVPIAFVGYLPSLVLLDRNTEAARFGLPAAVPYLSPLVAVITWLVARAVWRLGLRHHRSTGS